MTCQILPPEVLVISTTVPSSLITLTPPAVAKATVTTGNPVAGSMGALGRTVMATSLTVLLTRKSDVK